MPVIPAPAGSAMSSFQHVRKLVGQTNAERGAVPVPILHVSSSSSEQPMQVPVDVQTTVARRIAGG